jgi:tripartite-type tricarboxylate transporter receptor subunit TctC
MTTRGTGLDGGDASYPGAPLRLIIPEVVGSAADLMSRIIGDGFAAITGQPVIYENLFLEAGVTRGATAAPDGYTLLYGSAGNLALLPHVKKIAVDPLQDLLAVGRFVIQPSLLAVNPALPVNNLQELVAMMRAQPGHLRMSTAGAGTSGHFAGELLIAQAGVQPEVVHYHGGGPAIEAVVNNDAQWTMAPIAGRLPHVRSGKLRAIAIGSPARLRALPEVPTIAESGYPAYSAVGWGGIFVPKGTPQAVIERLNAIMAVAIATPALRARFEAQGAEPAGGTPQEMAEILARDHACYGELAAQLGLRIE